MHSACESESSKQTTDSGMHSRLKKGIGAQGFSQGVQIFIRLAEIPLLLAFWGPQLYGEWLMLAAIPAYLAVSDGGFASAACREMTMRSAAGDQNGTLAVFQSIWTLLNILSFAILLLAFTTVQLAPLGNWLHLSAMTGFEVKITLLLLVLYVLVGFQAGLLNGGFWITGHYANGMYFFSVVQLLEFIGLGTAVACGGRPIHAAAGCLAGRSLGTVFMWIGQQRVSPWLRHGTSAAAIAVLKKLSAPAFASLAFPLGNALNVQGTRLVVGLLLGPSALALFVPIRTLSRLVMQPATIINRLLEPELAIAYGAGDSTLFRLLFTKSCQCALWGCLGACFLVGPGAHWIFPIWTGGKLAVHWPTYFVLLGGVLINGIWYTALMVPYATNRHCKVALAYALVYGATVVGLCFFVVTGLGLLGAALALLLGEIAMSLIVLSASWRMAGVSMTQWVGTVLHPPLYMFSQVIVVIRNLRATAL